MASTFMLPPSTLAKVSLLAARDLFAAARHKEPMMIPAYGEPGSTALLASPDSVAGIEALIPPGDDTSGDITARFGVDIVRYFPGRDAHEIQCPAHFAACEDDTFAPSGPALRHVRKAPKVEVRMQPGGHFDIFVGDAFERNVSEQLDFRARYVPTAVNGT